MSPRSRNLYSSGSTVSLFCRREHRQFPQPHLVATPSEYIPYARWTPVDSYPACVSATPHSELLQSQPSALSPSTDSQMPLPDPAAARPMSASHPIRACPRQSFTVVVSNRPLPQMRHAFRTVDLTVTMGFAPPTPSGTGVRADVPVCLVFSRPPYYRCGTVN